MAIDARFTADFSQWSSAVQGAQQDLDGLKQGAEDVSPAVGLLAADVGRQIREVTGQVVSLGSQYVKAYAEDEAATQKLVTALQAQGTATQAVIGQYADMATQFQKTTTFADDAVTGAQAVLTTIGKVGPEQMQLALDAATNLATFYKIDLNTAATMVSKALASGGESLGKLAPLFEGVETKGMGAAQMLGTLNEKLGPQATAAANTTAGSMERLKNQFGDVEEKVGGLLVKGLTPLLNFFTSMPEPLQTVIATVAVLGTALAPIAVAIAALVTAAAPLVALLTGGAGLAAAFTAVTAALAALAPFLLIGGVIVAGVIAVWQAFKHWDEIKAWVISIYETVKMYLVDKFNAILGAIQAPINAVTGFFRGMWDKVAGHSYVPDMMTTIADQFGRLPSIMTGPAQVAAQATTEAFQVAQAALDDAARAFVDSPFNRMSKNFMTILTDSGGVAHDAYGKPVAVGGELGTYLARSLGQQNIQVTINGSVLSTQEQIAMAMNDALLRSYRQGGNRVPI